MSNIDDVWYDGYHAGYEECARDIRSGAITITVDP